MTLFGSLLSALSPEELGCQERGQGVSLTPLIGLKLGAGNRPSLLSSVPGMRTWQLCCQSQKKHKTTYAHTCTCLCMNRGAHHSSEEGLKVPLRSHVPAWALLPAFFPFFCFNTLACLRKSCQKLLPVYIVDLMFLIVLHRRDWILILGTWKWWDVHSMYSSFCVSRKHLLRVALSAQSSPHEEPDSSLWVRPFPVLFGQAQRGEKTC